MHTDRLELESDENKIRIKYVISPLISAFVFFFRNGCAFFFSLQIIFDSQITRNNFCTQKEEIMNQMILKYISV